YQVAFLQPRLLGGALREQPLQPGTALRVLADGAQDARAREAAAATATTETTAAASRRSPALLQGDGHVRGLLVTYHRHHQLLAALDGPELVVDRLDGLGRLAVDRLDDVADLQASLAGRALRVDALQLDAAGALVAGGTQGGDARRALAGVLRVDDRVDDAGVL